MPHIVKLPLLANLPTPRSDLSIVDQSPWPMALGGDSSAVASFAVDDQTTSIFDHSVGTADPFFSNIMRVPLSLSYYDVSASMIQLDDNKHYACNLEFNPSWYPWLDSDFAHECVLEMLAKYPDLADVLQRQHWPNIYQVTLRSYLSIGSELNFKYVTNLLAVLDDEELTHESTLKLIETIISETGRMAPRIFKDLPEVITCLSGHGWPMLLQVAFFKKYFHAAAEKSMMGLKDIQPVILALGSSNWSFVEQSRFLLLLCSKNPANITEIFHALPGAIVSLRELDLPKSNQHDILVDIIESEEISPSAMFCGLPAMIDALKPLDWDLEQKLSMLFLLANKLGAEFVTASKFIKPIFETLNSLKYEYEEQKVLCTALSSRSIPASLILMDVQAVFRALHEAKWSVQNQAELLKLIIRNSGCDAGLVLKTVPHVLSSVSLRPLITDPVRFVQEFYASISYDFKSGCEINVNIALCKRYSELNSEEDFLATDIAYTVMKEVDRFNSEPGHIEKTLPRLQTNMIRLAQIVDLSIGTQVFKSVPGGNIGLIDRYKQLAEDISFLVDNNKWGVLRETIHNRPSSSDKALLQEYRVRAVTAGNQLAVTRLDEALLIFSRLYEQYFDQVEFQSMLGGQVSSQLRWMDDPNSLQQLGSLAVSVRRVYDDQLNDLSAKSRYELIRLMIAIDHFAYAKCSLNSDEKNTLGEMTQREKISCLLRVAYGCGYGKEGLVHLADRIDRIQQLDVVELSDLDLLRSYASLIYRLLQDFEHRFRETFAPMIQYYGDDLNVPAAIRPGFSSNKYRATGLFNLDNHLNTLNVTGANDRLTKQVLSLLGQESDFDFAALDYHEGSFPQNRLVVGGKGLGLNYLALRHPDHVPAGFVLPARPAGYRLSDADKIVIREAVARLEMKTGKTLGLDLAVSVRSGGPVSMPGAMETKLFVQDMGSIFEHVESVYQSWNSPSARAYRRQNGIPEDWGTAVNIVQMVRGDFDENSGSGIVVSNFELSYAAKTCGDKIADGVTEGNDSMTPEVRVQLSKFIAGFEEDLGYPVEVEFTVQSGYLYLLQIRRANLTRQQEITWYTKRYLEGLMPKKVAVKALGGRLRLEKDLEVTVVNNSDEIEAVATGAFGEGKPYSGKIALNTTDIADDISNGESVIYVTDDPDARRSTADALLAGAFVVSGGGQLAHLFSVARDQQLSFVAGAGFMIIPQNRSVRFGNEILTVGDTITIDPATNKIYPGKLSITTGLSPVRSYIQTLLAKD